MRSSIVTKTQILWPKAKKLATYAYWVYFLVSKSTKKYWKTVPCSLYQRDSFFWLDKTLTGMPHNGHKSNSRAGRRLVSKVLKNLTNITLRPFQIIFLYIIAELLWVCPLPTTFNWNPGLFSIDWNCSFQSQLDYDWMSL